MRDWNTTLIALRNQDEEWRDNAPLILDDLKLWLETHMTPWADRWFGQVLISGPNVVVCIWLTEHPFPSSPWVTTGPSSPTLGRVLYLKGSLLSLQDSSDQQALRYDNNQWQASDALLTLWMDNITDVVRKQHWAPPPTTSSPIGLARQRPLWTRRLAQGLGIITTLDFFDLLLLSHPYFPAGVLFSDLIIIFSSFLWAFWP